MAAHAYRGIRAGAALAMVLVAAALLLAAPAAQGALVGLWRLDTSSGGSPDLTPNDAIGGAPGTLNNGAAIVVDATRGSVLQTDGSNDYVRGGRILPLHQTNDDFTWAFWAKQDSSQGVNNDVILGNRFGGAGGHWVKFTPNKFEYRPVGDIDYANIASDDTWHHHAVVKHGSTLTYYRDGSFTPGDTMTATGNINLLPFFMGGDSGGEQWQGRLDDVALYDRALTQAQVQAAMSGSFSAGQPPAGYRALHDPFSGTAVDTGRWDVIEKGLEIQGPGTAPNYTATVAGGQLTISGTNDRQYWPGLSLRSTQSFSAGLRTEFAVDRIRLTGGGTSGSNHYRSSIWLWGDDNNFLHFSQNTENGWQYNYLDGGSGPGTGGGVNIGLLDPMDGDRGAHGMKLVFLPGAGTSATIQMYVDGQLAASQSFANWTPGRFYAIITGQARASDDWVTAVFDNAEVYVLPEPGTLALLGLGGALAAARRRRRAV